MRTLAMRAVLVFLPSIFFFASFYCRFDSLAGTQRGRQSSQYAICIMHSKYYLLKTMNMNELPRAMSTGLSGRKKKILSLADTRKKKPTMNFEQSKDERLNGVNDEKKNDALPRERATIIHDT